jgi:7-cyano-7-deazaguanine synthase in queuosine biosynthesis
VRAVLLLSGGFDSTDAFAVQNLIRSTTVEQ